jgi:GABA permease
MVSLTRYLVLANQTLGDQDLLDRLVHVAQAGANSIHVMVPATHLSDQEHALNQSEHVTFWPGEAKHVTVARTRLHTGLERLRGMGVQASGDVGDPDPMKAIQEALSAGEFDEILVSTLPRSKSRWLRQNVLQRATRRFGLPASHVQSMASASPAPLTGGVGPRDA